MPAKGDVHDHLSITHEGRAYLSMRTILDRDQSLLEFAEQRLKKPSPWDRSSDTDYSRRDLTQRVATRAGLAGR